MNNLVANNIISKINAQVDILITMMWMALELDYISRSMVLTESVLEALLFLQGWLNGIVFFSH